MALSPNLYESLMRRCLELAAQAEGLTDPNPMVGALLVDEEGRILSEGFHPKAGEPHAEVFALQNLDRAPEGSTLFVNLEPCSHQGRTPPCADLLIEKKVQTVIIGQEDPNPLVAGRGIERLRKAGVRVISGILRQECQEFNRIFNRHIQTGRPYVTVKAAITLDGKIAMESGESQWISSPESRRHAHELRGLRQAILIGRNTFFEDNPRLTNRNENAKRQPIPVLVASGGELWPESHLFLDKSRIKYYIASEQIETAAKIREAGFRLLTTKGERVDLAAALRQMHQEGIGSILVEGGSRITGSLIKAGLVDELMLYLCPRVIGDAFAPDWVSGLNLQSLQETPWFEFATPEPLGPDLLIKAYPKR